MINQSQDKITNSNTTKRLILGTKTALQGAFFAFDFLLEQVMGITPDTQKESQEHNKDTKKRSYEQK